MNKSSLFVLAALVSASLGCHRNERKVSAETNVTAATLDTTSVSVASVDALEEFRNNARADIANLEARIGVLEGRLEGDDDPSAASQARLEIAKARENIDVLKRDLDMLAADRLETQRTAMDRDWEAASTSLDRAGELLSDSAR